MHDINLGTSLLVSDSLTLLLIHRFDRLTDTRKHYYKGKFWVFILNHILKLFHIVCAILFASMVVPLSCSSSAHVLDRLSCLGQGSLCCLCVRFGGSNLGVPLHSLTAAHRIVISIIFRYILYCFMSNCLQYSSQISNAFLSPTII